MAYGVLTRLGGDISAQNRPEGGACFTLSFPVASRPSTPPPPPSSSNPPSGRHILVVDDDVDNLEATRMAMELDGQAVDIARSGSEAIERLRAGVRYDLVLCDLGMPDMNGWRVAREIQAVAPGTTVYMLTGWAQEIADRRSAPQVGQRRAGEADELGQPARSLGQRAPRAAQIAEPPLI